MNMLKVFKLSVLSLVVFNTSAFAATFSSGLVPFNGAYNVEINNICAADSSYANSLPPVSVINEALIGNLTFNPDATQTSKISSIDAYNKWIAYVTPLTAVAPPVLSQVTDPTSTTTPLAKLIETPIQWGITNESTSESDVTYPYTSMPVGYHNRETAYVVITKYTLSNPVFTNSVFSTGYAIYRQHNGQPWKSIRVYPNAFSTSPTLTAATNLLVLEQYTNPTVIGSQTYTFNCRSKVNLFR